MAVSQNLLFSGGAAFQNNVEPPAGAWIAKLIHDGLQVNGWQVFTIDNWRDSGWSFGCGRGSSKVCVILAKPAELREWIVQIIPSHVPSFFQRLFGGKPSALPQDIYATAQGVHAILSKQKEFRGFQWSWDAYPSAERSTPEPTAP